MKNLMIITVVTSVLLAACAPKEKGQNNTPIRTQSQRGLDVNNRQNDPKNQNKGQPDQQQTNEGPLVNLERFSKDLGFFAVNDKQIPGTVQEAAGSVFQLMLLVADESADSYKLIKKSELKDKQNELRETINKHKELDGFEKMVMNKQIDGCLNSADIKDDENCTLLFNSHRGTGFLAGDGSTLWTNAHVIESFVNAVAKLGNLSLEEQVANENSIRVYVFDHKNNLVLDPYKNKVVIEQLPAATKYSAGSQKFYAEDNDYVTLRLSQAIGRPLQWAKRTASINNAVYLLGYAGCTDCKSPNGDKDDEETRLDYSSRSPAPNFNGQGIVATRGSVIFPDDTVVGFYQMNKQQATQTASTILHYTADSQRGMSGAPVLNARGEVVAIHRGGRSRKFSGKFYRISNAVIPPAVLTAQ